MYTALLATTFFTQNVNSAGHKSKGGSLSEGNHPLLKACKLWEKCLCQKQMTEKSMASTCTYSLSLRFIFLLIVCLIEIQQILRSFLQLKIKGSFLWSKLPVGTLRIAEWLADCLSSLCSRQTTNLSLNSIIK